MADTDKTTPATEPVGEPTQTEDPKTLLGDDGGAPTDAKDAKATDATDSKDATGADKKTLLGDDEDGEKGDKTDEGDEADEADGGNKDDRDDKDAGAIEVTLPEGFEVDSTLLGVLKETAKDSEHAQKLVDAYVEAQKQQILQAREGWAKQVEGWAKELAEHPEFGGENFKANLRNAQRAMKQFGTPELRGWLNETGLGNRPELVMAFAAVGKAMAEDSVAGTSSGTPRRRPSEEERLRMKYPTHFQE